MGLRGPVPVVQLVPSGAALVGRGRRREVVDATARSIPGHVGADSVEEDTASVEEYERSDSHPGAE